MNGLATARHRLAHASALAHCSLDRRMLPGVRDPSEYDLKLPDVSERREPLEALTRRFERTWYASEAASPADFDFALSQLAKIGCR